jgi:glycosyltransferase involved in cell wall biosynthesis
MKIAVIFDALTKGGGGYYQSLNTALILNNIKNEDLIFEFITTIPNVDIDLKKNKINTILFKKSKSSRFYYIISQSKIINFFLRKFNIINPFSRFIKSRKFDLVFFLGPSFYINCCNEVNFVVNIYDLNYKFDNFFPEYKSDKIFNDTDQLIAKSVNRAFKLLVDSQRTKEELIQHFNCQKNKISVYPFSTHLTRIYKELSQKSNSRNILTKIGISEDLKFFFYPAQFWSHKNHKYLIDVIKNLKKINKLDFKIIFCGSDKGNRIYIENIIKNEKLDDDIIIYNYLTDEQVIALYSNCLGLLMPTYVARSTLPLYEGFFFKIPVFYSEGVLDKKLEEFIIKFDLTDPLDLANKLINYNDLIKKHISNIEKAYEYFMFNCNDLVKENILRNIISEYKYLSQRWV